MNYKAALYEKYVTSHIAQRKGAADAQRALIQSRVFDGHFGRLLPTARGRAADLGCGPGTLVRWLRQNGFAEVHGVDFSGEQVANAEALGITGVTQGDVFEFLDRESGFDLLFARDLIEHFDKQTVYDFLLKCRGALNPSGRLILQVPNAESPYFGRVRYGDFTHELAFNGSSIRQLLGATGFARVEVHPWRPGIFNLKSRLRYLAWRLIEPILKLPIAIESGGKDRIVTMNLIAVAVA